MVALQILALSVARAVALLPDTSGAKVTPLAES